MLPRAQVRALLEEARRVDGEIRSIHRRRNKDAVSIACLLLDLKERGLATALGFESVAAYASRVLDYSSSKTRDLISMATRLRELPHVRQVAEKGELPWTKLRTITSVASPENENEWIERARAHSSRDLELMAKVARGEEPLEKIVIEVSPSQKADIEDAVRAVLQEDPTLTFGAAIALVCRRALGGSAAGRSSHRVLVTTCSECKKATRETRDGPIEVTPSELDRFACDAEILDIRNGPARLRRTMPPKVANFVDARDKKRCRVPGCKNRGHVERHHEGGWRVVGHDPRHTHSLCSQHHDARHEGTLTIEEDGDRVRFLLADGTLLGTVFDPVGASREANTKADANVPCLT